MPRTAPLRLIDDKTFHDLRSEADPKRPEWRRSFNLVSFTAGRPSISRSYTVNEVDQFPELRVASGGAEAGKASVFGAARRQARITARVPQKSVRDTFYFTRQREGAGGEFVLERAKGDIELVITEAAPTEERGPFAEGSFGGLAFRNKRDPENDHLHIDVAIPSEFMAEIIANLERDGRQALSIGIEVESFSSEADEAHREWFQPRDLFLHGLAVPAALVSLRIAPGATASNDEESASSKKPEEKAAPVPSLPAAPSQPPSQVARLIAGANAALWVIAALLALHFFFK